MRKIFGVAAGLITAAVVVVSPGYAALTTFTSFNGTVAVSTDGFGSSLGDGTLTANAPVGSTVLAAYLYSATQNTSSTPTVNLNGTAVTFGPSVPNATACCSLASFRSDVTSIVAPIINGGGGGAYNFSYSEGGLSNVTDGSALVVVYSNAVLPTASVGILDGFASVTGDTTSINFATPLDTTQAGFFAEMRLGIGFSCCDTQSSNVTINGTLITANAGDRDDGLDLANGSLITMGGDDDAFSALLPTYANDHERYNLVPQITNGDTTITLVTANASKDDNIFLSVFHVSGIAGFNEPPPTNNVPEPGTFLLMGIGMAAMGLRGLRARKR